MKDLNTRIGKRLLALVLAFAMVIGMIPGTAAAAKNNAVNFEVKDSSGKAVADAKVTVTFVVENGENQTETKYTGGNGKREFTYEGNPANVTSVSYEVVKEDYVTVKKTTSLGSDEKIELVKSEIIMTIVDAENKPITSAVASYKVNGEGETKTAAANSNGVIVIDLAATDTKVVGSINAAGYASIVGEIENGSTGTFTMPKAQVVFNVKAGEDAAAGAAVKVTVGENEISAATDENGYAVVDLSTYAVNTDTKVSYTVDKDGSNAAKDGYKTATGTVAVGGSANVQLEKAYHKVSVAVTDADGAALKDVVVTYQLDEMTAATMTTDANGNASVDVARENPNKLSYSATVAGTTYANTVDCGENATQVDIKADNVVTVTVSTNGSGSGTITVNGTAVANGDKLVVAKGVEIPVVVTPSEKNYISSLTVNGTEAAGAYEKYAKYEGTYTFNAGAQIKAEFIQTYNVTLVCNPTNGGSAYILRNDEDLLNSPVTVDAGDDSLYVYVLSNSGTNYGYEIDSVTGVDVRDANGNTVDVAGLTELSFAVGEVKSDMEITVAFRLMSYAVTVENDSNCGDAVVSANPVEHGSSLTLTVQPYKDYVIDSVVVTGLKTLTETVYFGNDFSDDAITIENVREPLKIAVTYSNIHDAVIGDFTITAVDASGNDVTADKLVRHDGNKLFVFKPDTKVKVSTVEAGKYNVLRLEKIETWTNIFGQTKSVANYVAGGSKAIHTNGENSYIQWQPLYVVDPVYANAHGDEISAASAAAGQRITLVNAAGVEYTVLLQKEGWKQYYTTQSLTTNDDPYRFAVGNYTDGIGWTWSKLSGLNIVFDDTDPVINLKAASPAANSHGYHNGDVTLTVEASDAETHYSGIASIEWFVSTTAASVEDIPADAVWTGYTYDGRQKADPSFTIKASDYNAENVYVFVRATDMADNVYTKLVETLHINSNSPKIKATIACASGHDVYCNCEARTITMEITDRADTVRPNVNIMWARDDNWDLEDTCSITWTEEVDESGNSTGMMKGTATYDLTEEGEYHYWAVEYANKAAGETKEADGTVTAHGVLVTDFNTFFIDRTKPESAALTVQNKPESGIFNSETVTVLVEVTDTVDKAKPMTGINSITYEVKCDDEVTESGTLFTCGDEIRNGFSGEITVHSDLNNSCNVVVYVTVTDNAGNTETFASEVIDIDRTAPVVNISFDNNDAENDSYFDEKRTATITVTERFDHVDAADVVCEITAKDAEGNGVEVPVLSAWSWDERVVHGDLIDFTATVEFAADANYTFKFAFTDKAGNACTYADGTVAEYAFTVDMHAPTGGVHTDAVIVTRNEDGTEAARETKSYDWSGLIDPEVFAFGIWSNESITVTGKADDVTSPIWKVDYYKSNDNASMNAEALDKLEETEWKPVTNLVSPEIEGLEDISTYDVGVYTGNEKFTIYLRITDMAGNPAYISTNGMILDDKEPAGVQPEDGAESVGEIGITIPAGNAHGFQTGNFNVGISVIDPKYDGSGADATNGTFAGLKSIGYELKTTDTGKSVTGTLFDAGNGNLRSGSAMDEATGLYYSWTGSIPVDAATFNSNHVILTIVAVDNAGNVQTTTTEDGQIKIDIVAPTITVSYDNNSPDSGSFYKADRTATIEIKERNFDPNAVTALVSKDGVSIATLSPDKWQRREGAAGGNGDDTVYVQTISYNVDGDYTFAIECTDLADWTCGNVGGKTYTNSVVFAGGTQNATEFTIDKTAPTIAVSYNNNDAVNGKYFKAARTASITIVEHNFDLNRVTFTQNEARGGKRPSVSWRSNGDTHVATITYDVDGDYIFDVTMTDKAGNSSGAANYGRSVAGKDFVLDTTYTEMITITGVEDGAAYGYADTVVPVISIADINLDTHEVTLTGIQKDKTIDLTAEVLKLLNVGTENVSGTLNLFEVVQDLDGIYTLIVTGTDKAGNVDTEQVTFTVNRFGSVYVYGEYLSELIANGGSYVFSVDDDLIITEYNADKLLAGSLMIEVTRDGKPLEDLIYEISPEINENAKPGTSGWYQYTYTISAENFAADGVYKISVASKDATGNTPENTNYEDMGITFRVDSTPAEITSIVGLEEAIINASEIEVKYTIFDTIGLKSVKIYVDGELVDEITDFTGDMNNFTGSIHLTESRAAQSVRLVVEDMSGNITDTAAEDFSSAYAFNESVTVSTNFFVRWYANRVLFWGSIIGGVGLAALLWFILVSKRKKDEESAQ